MSESNEIDSRKKIYFQTLLSKIQNKEIKDIHIDKIEDKGTVYFLD